jgi:hypothetical protein
MFYLQVAFRHRTRRHSAAYALASAQRTVRAAPDPLQLMLFPIVCRTCLSPASIGGDSAALTTLSGRRIPAWHRKSAKGNRRSSGHQVSIQSMINAMIRSCSSRVRWCLSAIPCHFLRHPRQQVAVACCAMKTGWPRIGVWRPSLRGVPAPVARRRNPPRARG